MRTIRLFAFLLKQFLLVPVFLQTMALTTIGSVLTQYLAYHAWGGNLDAILVRSTIIGMWTLSTMSAGIIGFERFRGTLVYLVNSTIGSMRAIAGVVLAPALSGLLALPLAWITLTICSLLGEHSMPSFTLSWWQFIIIMLFSYLSCTIMSLLIATTFVLTPYAITYEPLILTPAFLLGGVVFLESSMPTILQWLSYLIPLSYPIHYTNSALNGNNQFLWLFGTIVVSLIWFIIVVYCSRLALLKARKAGTLEVI